MLRITAATWPWGDTPRHKKETEKKDKKIKKKEEKCRSQHGGVNGPWRPLCTSQVRQYRVGRESENIKMQFEWGNTEYLAKSHFFFPKFHDIFHGLYVFDNREEWYKRVTLIHSRTRVVRPEVGHFLVSTRSTVFYPWILSSCCTTRNSIIIR